MNTKSLINKVLVRSPFGKEQSSSMMKSLFEEIKSAVIEEKHADIENFGSFIVEHRKMTTAVNKKKGAEYLVPPKDRVVFVPSETLIEKLNSR